MAFDIQGALSSGYSEAEVSDFLAKEQNFNIQGARQSGYNEAEILSFLSPKDTRTLKSQIEVAPEERPTSFLPTGEGLTQTQRQEGGKGIAREVFEGAKPVVEALGLAGGAIAGAASPVPGGAIIGASLGFAGAKNLIELVEEQLGIKMPKTALQQLAELPSELAEGAAMEMGGQVAGVAIPAIAKRAVSPVQTLLRKQATESLAEPIAKEGLKVAEVAGMELTPAQITGNRFLLLAENTARRAGTTADQIHKHDIKVAGQAIDRITKFMNKLGKRGVSDPVLGEQIRGSVKFATKTVQKVRKKFAIIDYGRVRKLAGDEPVIGIKNLKSEFSRIAKEYDIPGGEKIVKQAKSLMQQLPTKTKITPPSEIVDIHGRSLRPSVTERVEPKVIIGKAMNIRAAYSDASKGTGQIFDDIDSALQRKLATRLIKAFEKDFDIAPTTAKGNLAEALKLANSNYSKYSKSIDAIENSVLGKLLGRDVNDAIISGQSWNTIPPEKIVKALLKMHPSELKTAKALLQRASPETWSNIRRHSVEKALTIGKDIPPSAGLNPIPLSSSKFIKALPKEEQAQHLFDKKELAELEMINNALIRFGDRTGANFSNTAVMQQFTDMIAALISKVGLLKYAGTRVGLKTIANAMTTPEGRKAIMTTLKPNVSNRVAESAAKAILLYSNEEETKQQGE